MGFLFVRFLGFLLFVFFKGPFTLEKKMNTGAGGMA